MAASAYFMRPSGPFGHQQCELVNVPIFSAIYCRSRSESQALQYGRKLVRGLDFAEFQ
jgi:hypothetical protein